MQIQYKVMTSIIIAVALLLNGCASTPRYVDRSLVQGKNIVLVPALYEELGARETGATVFNNWSKTISYDYWPLNDLISSKIKSQLKDSYIVSVENIPNAYEEFKDYKEFYATNIFKISGRKDRIKEIAKTNSADIVLIIVPSLMRDVFFNTNQFVRGHGVYQRSIIGSGRGITYVAFSVFVYDGLTGDELAISPGIESIENNFIIAEDQSVPKELTEKIRKDILELYEKSITRVLHSTDLL